MRPPPPRRPRGSPTRPPAADRQPAAPKRRALDLAQAAAPVVRPTREAIAKASVDPEPAIDTPAVTEEERKRKLHEHALDCFLISADSSTDQRDRELEDLNFELDQWPKEYRQERAGGMGPDGRMTPAKPCLQIDKIDQPIQQVLSEGRQSKLGIQIKPKGRKSSIEVARVRQGLIRAIEVDSRASIARNWALDRCAKCGRGAYRIAKRYCNNDDNDMELVVVRILNQHSVYLDPFAIEPDWSDGKWAFITYDIPESEFKRRWPKTELTLAGQEKLKALGDSAPTWITTTKKGKVYRVAEFYYVVETERQRAFCTGLGWRFLDELTDSEKELVEPRTVRPVTRREVKWVMLNGMGIMDEEDWEGEYIPIIPVIGKEYNIDGKRVFKGIISNAKDAQRSYNVMRSRQLEAIGLASLATWVMAEGQDEGYEDMWDRANTSNFTRMIYKPTTIDGLLAPPPHRDIAEPAIQAITIGVREAENDIKSTTGRFDASLGRSLTPDQSGRAIAALQSQGETGTSIYLDNLAYIAMVHEGKVLNGLLEHIYDREGRIVQILGDEDEPSEVMLNQHYAVDQNDEMQPVSPDAFNPDEHKFYDLKDGGQYRVVVDIGRAAKTQAEADKQFMSEVAQAAPSLVPIFADLWVRASGSRAATLIADRIKRNNPYAKGEDDKEQQAKIPPAVQQRMGQMQQQLQQAIAVIKKQQGLIDGEKLKMMGELQRDALKLKTQERLALLEVKKELMIERAKLDAKQALTLLDHDIETIEAEKSRVHDINLQREEKMLEALFAQLTAPTGGDAGPGAEPEALSYPAADTRAGPPAAQ